MNNNKFPPWMTIALEEIGVTEIAGAGNNNRVLEYHKCTKLEAKNDSVAWCSAFVNFVMKNSGFDYTKSALARSWLKWGEELEKPLPGCLVIFSRGTSTWSGHVGFFVDDVTTVTSKFTKVLGGNQSDQVKISNYHTSKILGYRWPKDFPKTLEEYQKKYPELYGPVIKSKTTFTQKEKELLKTMVKAVAAYKPFLQDIDFNNFLDKATYLMNNLPSDKKKA